jgi:uncharacterized protein
MQISIDWGIMLILNSSKYNILVPLKNDRCLAYNSLKGGLALWEPYDLKLYERIQMGEVPGGNDASLEGLMHGGFVFQGFRDELAILEEEYRNHRYDGRTLILTIAPTLDCNFGCDYCFQGSLKEKETMTGEVQDGIVELVKRISPELKRLHVAWYGGEPLLKRTIIESLSSRLIAFCDRNSIYYDSMIVTNGYQLKAPMARSLYVHRVKTVQVTLDGQPDYHDARRPLRTGRPTFEHIVQNLSSVVDEVPISLSIRVNVDSRNLEGIAGLMQRLAGLGLNRKKNLKLYFAPVEATTQACHTISDFCMSKCRYGEEEVELYHRGFEAGLTDLPYPPRFHGNCGAVRLRGFVILPNGDIHKCWNTVMDSDKKVGTVFDINALNSDQTLQDWLDWNPFECESCKNCKILPNCSGGCGYKFLYSKDMLGEAAQLPCISWRYNINEMLVLRAVKTGIIKEDDYDLAQIKTDPDSLIAGLPGKDGAFSGKMRDMSVGGIPLNDRPMNDMPVTSLAAKSQS